MHSTVFFAQTVPSGSPPAGSSVGASHYNLFSLFNSNHSKTSDRLLLSDTAYWLVYLYILTHARFAIGLVHEEETMLGKHAQPVKDEVDDERISLPSIRLRLGIKKKRQSRKGRKKRVQSSGPARGS